MNKMFENRETEGAGFHSYHSSRKERYAVGHINESKVKNGFFQRNPSFKILFIDLIFIVIISGVIVPFIYRREGVSSIDNYSLELRAFYYDSNIMASLTVRGKEGSNIEDSYVSAYFYTEESQEGIGVEDLLPDPGEERLLKAVLPHLNQEYLLCRIEINGTSRTIKKKIK